MYRNITISGLPGAGSSTLGKGLADKLGWTYFSGGDFMRQYAIEKGSFDRNENFHHDATVYGEDFDRQVDYGMRKALRDEDKRIYDAWLAGFVAQQIDDVLKVLVWCSDDAVRIDRIVNRDKVKVEEAKRHIFGRETKNRNKWVRMYKDDWDKWVVGAGILSSNEPVDFWHPKLYDLAIDTYKYNREEALQQVLERLS